MEVRLVGNEKTGDYAVVDGKRHLGVLYREETSWLGRCWIFDVQAKGAFGRDVYYYSTPELAERWIPREVRNEKAESALYGQSQTVFY